MPSAKCSPEEFAAIWQSLHGHTPSIAKAIGCDIRNVMKRRHSVEQQLGIILAAGGDRTGRAKVTLPKIGARRLAKVTGTVIVFSDAHFWPGEDRSPAFRALTYLIKDLRPVLVVMNGDAFDGSRISRFPPADGTRLPEVADELDICAQRLAEIEEAVQQGVPLVWNIGNHDLRYSSRLAQTAPEFCGIHGMDLKDHFPAWDFGWSLSINGTVMVKHRYSGGVHAAYQNTLKGGLSMVTGHLHRLCVTPWSDYNGTRWGVDTGTLSSFGPEVQKFTYSEDAPKNWASGFAVLTFDDHGRLLPPELCQVIDGRAYFRGKQVTPGVKILKRAA